MVAETLEREIRTLRALLFSERDPDGRGFAPLADALRRAGDLGQALELVLDGVERLPDFATGHVVAGWVYRARGEENEAERSFRRVLELDDENVSALRGLGFLLADRGEDPEALDVFRRLDELDPGDPEVRARLTELGDGERTAATGVVPIESLAPADAGRPVVDIEALAPGPPGGEAGVSGAAAAAGPVVDIRDLAPSGAGTEPPVDIRALAPEEPEVIPGEPEVEEVEEPGARVGGAVVSLSGAERGEAADPAGDPDQPGPWTRTMAELYVRQGLPDRAVEVYRRLVERSPGDDDLRARLRELEAERDAAMPRPPPAPAVAAEDEDARLEDLAEHMAAGPAVTDEPDEPFAWGGISGPDDEEADADAPGGPVSEYFQALLAWTPRARESGGATGDAASPGPEPGEAGGGESPPSGAP